MIGFPLALVPRSYLEFARALDEYFARAHIIGIDRAKAEEILAQEVAVAKASPALSSLQAISRASRRLAE